jgi:hypothetical protein
VIPSSDLVRAAAWVAAGAAVLLFLNALVTARRSQRAAYYSVRRDAQRMASRRLSIAGLAALAAAGLFAASALIPAAAPPALEATPPVAAAARISLDPSATPEPTAMDEPADSPLSSPLPTPTSPAKATPIPEPTSALISPLPTPASTAKATPILEPTSALISPLPAPTIAEPTPLPGPVAPNRRLVLNAIASGIDDNGLPLGAGTEFTPGVRSIYIFFDFRDVPPSALLRQAWFRDGGSVNFRSERFGLTGDGVTYVVWSPRNGFRAGLYEVRLALGGVQQFVANFEVK